MGRVFNPIPPGPIEHHLDSVSVHGVQMLRHAESEVLFIPGQKGWRRNGVHRYDELGLNISVRYTLGRSALVSMYVFPFPQPGTAAVFDKLLAASKKDMLACMQAPVHVLERGTAFAATDGDVVSGRRVEVTSAGEMQEGGQEFMLLDLFAHRTWMLKIRGSGMTYHRVEIERMLNAWLAASTFGRGG